MDRKVITHDARRFLGKPKACRYKEDAWSKRSVEVQYWRVYRLQSTSRLRHMSRELRLPLSSISVEGMFIWQPYFITWYIYCTCACVRVCVHACVGKRSQKRGVSVGAIVHGRVMWESHWVSSRLIPRVGEHGPARREAGGGGRERKRDRRVESSSD